MFLVILGYYEVLNTREEFMEILSLLGTLYSIAIFVVYIVLIGCASKLAVRLGRENGAWVFFSILFTPVLGIILLHCLGKTDEQEKNDFLERKMWENNV